MTIDEAKRDLPDVLAEVMGRVYTGKVAGRLRSFPVVLVKTGPERNRTDPSFEFEFKTSWEQIARKATDGTTIKYR